MARQTVLYFTEGRVPTKQELAEGVAMNAKFRNGSIAVGTSLEKADFVAGKVPAEYADFKVYKKKSAPAPTNPAAPPKGNSKGGNKDETPAFIPPAPVVADSATTDPVVTDPIVTDPVVDEKEETPEEKTAREDKELQAMIDADEAKKAAGGFNHTNQ
jgi:hypothetical protein